MKKFLILFLFVLMAQMSVSQIIKVENGISVSSLKEDFTHKVRPYLFMLNVEYCDKGWFDLSSGIGKLTKGGQMKIPLTAEDGTSLGYGDINMYADYLTLNTTFDLKYEKNRFALYVGAGPRIDIRLKTRYVCSSDDSPAWKGSDADGLMYGINCVAGVRYMINRVQLGLNVGYLFSFNEMYTRPDRKEVSEKTFTIGLSVGYQL